MHRSKLMGLVSLLTAEELRQADKFLRSPLEGVSKTTLKLFRYIRSYSPDYKSDRLNKAYVFNHLFPNDAYQDKPLRNQMHFLYKALSNFLIYQELQRDEGQRQRLFIEALYRRNDIARFEKLSDKYIEKLLELPRQDAQYAQTLVNVSETYYYHLGNADQKTQHDLVAIIPRHLDLYYCLSKMRFALDQLNKKSLSRQIQWPLIDIEDLLAQRELLSAASPIARLYFQLYAFHKQESPDLAEFEQAMNDLGRHIAQLEKMEAAILLKSLINIAVRHFTLGNQAFLSLAVRLFQLTAAHQLVLYQQQVASLFFLNVTILSSTAFEFEWTAKFIHDYQDYLAEEDREIVVEMSWAYWYFHRAREGKHSPSKDLAKALKHINQVPYSGPAIDLRIRSMTLRILYEQLLIEHNAPTFYHYADSFEKYIDRNTEVSADRLQGYLSFVRFTRRLGRLNSDKRQSRQKIEEIAREIETTKELVLKQWLQEKVEELNQLLHSA